MNERDVRLTYRFLGHKKETEMRLIDPTGKTNPLTHFVHNEEDFVNICKTYDGKMNIYVGINEHSAGGTKSSDVVNINAIIFDIDSLHPKDTAASRDEILAAQKTALEMLEYIHDSGHTAFLAFSGNGWQIWCPLKIPIDEANRFEIQCAIKELQKKMIEKFTAAGSKIDNIGDLGRVIKIIGTESVKPITSEDRPNRTSFWYTIPIGSGYGTNGKWSEKIVQLAKDVDWGELQYRKISSAKLDEETINDHLKRFDFTTIQLYNGKCNGYKSRSEAEFALVCRLARLSVPVEHVEAIMDNCAIGKWQEENRYYKNLTVNKAYAMIEEESNGPKEEKA